MDKPLPCIVCGFQPKSIDPNDDYRHVPSGALMFDAGSGHYGSTVWDTMTSGVALHVNVCDPCLREHRDRVAVVTCTAREVEYVWKPWRPEDDE